MNLKVQKSLVKLEPHQHFLLWNLGWKAYELFVEALNEQHVRSTYDRGDLELMSSWGKQDMNLEVQQPPIKLEPRQRFVLWNLGWDAYEKIVEALTDQHVRTTYDRGDLELMSPLPIHESVKVWFHDFLLALALEISLSFKSMAQTTFRRRDRDRGLEPDDCYYFAAMSKVADWNSLNLDRDPPPDLALEVDITSSCLNRMGVYAGLGVPEVWRFDGEEWHIHLLSGDGGYWESPSSAVIPYLPIEEMMPLMQHTLHMGADRERILHLTRWARERLLPLREAWQQQQQSPPSAG